MPKPSLTAIIPASDRRPSLPWCLEAIARASDPPEEQLVLESPAPLGSAQARNQGAVAATGDVLVFVDSDVEVHADVFVRIREAFEREPELTALFGSYDEAPPGGLVSRFRNLLHAHVHHASAGRAQTFWTGIGAVRRDAFLAAGGFDVSSPWIRDIEFGMRLRRAGAEIRLDPEIEGRHLKAWSLYEMLRTDFGRRGVPWVVLLLQYRAHPAALNLGWRHRLSAALSVSAFAALVARRPMAGLASLTGIVGLNRSFYALVLRRQGAAAAPAALALHQLHHLTAVAAVPMGIARYIADGRPAPPQASFQTLEQRASANGAEPQPVGRARRVQAAALATLGRPAA